ncbi:Hpt domain-containing protein [Ruegeria arenilitoris]|uniref:Hpt domain-containing protein n=1 Tax=Ruegeria arenilitoris TaxID=1173585 RepID=UPI00147F1B87|nr:Hpt domain-containing protein [Ruegeria arenilitoris]
MTKDIIDPTVFEELCAAMGEDFARELAATFLDDAENMFAELKGSVKNQDADTYRRAAHSIKSNAQTFGAITLSERARDIELSGEIDGAAVDVLRATFDQTATALTGLLNG